MICFDTCVLIWGLQGISNPELEGMPARTARYIDHLDQTEEEIIIPAPVLTEYLAGIKSKSKREEEQNRILETFFVPAIDVPVACLAAELQAKKIASAKRAKDENSKSCELKMEALIAATAIVNKAEALVTDDCSRYANLISSQLEVIEVPNLATQKMIFWNE